MLVKMPNDELIKFLVENRKDENGNLDLANLDLSKDFKNVYFDGMKVEGDLCQNFQTVGGNLYQDSQTVGNDLCQGHQTVGGDLYQNSQTAKRMLLQSHDGLEEGKDGFWRKAKTLAEKVAEIDIDEALKAEILTALKEGK